MMSSLMNDGKNMIFEASHSCDCSSLSQYCACNRASSSSDRRAVSRSYQLS